MELLVLASQYSDIEGEIIVWALNMVTKQLIKVHALETNVEMLSVGDQIEVIIRKECKRQEVWIEKCMKTGSYDDACLVDILDKKAATPYSVIEPSYTGNICKIEEFVSINENEVIVALYGFPRERKYLRIFDRKWCLYMTKNWNKDSDLLGSMNMSINKYLIIDFPEKNVKGKIQVAALVVV